MATVQRADAKFHVLIRGLKLDDATKALLDAAIRATVLRELATIDPNPNPQILQPAQDPATRALFGGRQETMGLVYRSEAAET